MTPQGGNDETANIHLVPGGDDGDDRRTCADLEFGSNERRGSARHRQPHSRRRSGRLRCDRDRRRADRQTACGDDHRVSAQSASDSGLRRRCLLLRRSGRRRHEHNARQRDQSARPRAAGNAHFGRRQAAHVQRRFGQLRRPDGHSVDRDRAHRSRARRRFRRVRLGRRRRCREFHSSQAIRRYPGPRPHRLGRRLHDASVRRHRRHELGHRQPRARIRALRARQSQRRRARLHPLRPAALQRPRLSQQPMQSRQHRRRRRLVCDTERRCHTPPPPHR